jgi:hypothetical protein
MDDPLEDTLPVMGSGDFLADMGYARPDEARAKFTLANRIALLVQESEMIRKKACAAANLTAAELDQIERGNVVDWPVERLSAAVAAVEVVADATAFMDEHDAAFRELAKR